MPKTKTVTVKYSVEFVDSPRYDVNFGDSWTERRAIIRDYDGKDVCTVYPRGPWNDPECLTKYRKRAKDIARRLEETDV